MKIRNGYVSNSSSSSFIVAKDLTNEGIACLKLTRAQKEKINGKIIYDEKINIYPDKDYWITEFIYDGYDKKWDILENCEHRVYSEGQMCGIPYIDSGFNEYPIDGDSSVYIRKEDDEVKQVKFNKFIKDFRNQYGKNSEVLVEYTDDNKIILIVVPEKF